MSEVSKKDKTSIINGKGSQEEIIKRADDIREVAKTMVGDEQKIAQYRLASMLGAVSVIYVGGNTESEIFERKDRVDDAVCAVSILTSGAHLERLWRCELPDARLSNRAHQRLKISIKTDGYIDVRHSARTYLPSATVPT